MGTSLNKNSLHVSIQKNKKDNVIDLSVNKSKNYLLSENRFLVCDNLENKTFWTNEYPLLSKNYSFLKFTIFNEKLFLISSSVQNDNDLG